MRTIHAGIQVFRRAPRSVAPLAIEGLVVAVLVLAGVFPARSGTVPAGAIFPLDVYFDVKHWLAFTDGWFSFVGVVLGSLLLRAGVLAGTFVLAGEALAGSRKVWLESVRLVSLAFVAFFPVAVLSFAGVAVRYAPFVWVAGVVGLPAAVILLRAAIRMDGGDGGPEARGLPELTTFVSYVWLVIAGGAAVAALGSISEFLAALLIALLGPLHALFLLGWRDNARTQTHSGGGLLLTSATVVALLAFGSAVLFDRYLRDAPPVSTARTPGRLLLLGGADSTSETGALLDLEVRDVGYPPGRSVLLSYRPDGRSYGAQDTHRDLVESARIISEQIERQQTSRLLGHSQASLILDRILDRDLPAPGASAVFAPAPPYPPLVSIPPPGEVGTGKAGGDA
ncbi:MAG TPA: hypothetical protein VNP73_00965, partial [Actinomycetota bacterium]|nr:hypothetical protein [Actinomycetota bacterium]